MDRGGVRRLALRAVRAAVAALTAVGDLLQRNRLASALQRQRAPLKHRRNLCYTSPRRTCPTANQVHH